MGPLGIFFFHPIVAVLDVIQVADDQFDVVGECYSHHHGNHHSFLAIGSTAFLLLVMGLVILQPQPIILGEKPNKD